MNYVSRIVDAFGGVRPMSAAIGKPVSTVHSWKVRGSIPDEAKTAVLTRAHELGIPLRPEHFFPLSDDDTDPQTQKGSAA